MGQALPLTQDDDRFAVRPVARRAADLPAIVTLEVDRALQDTYLATFRNMRGVRVVIYEPPP